MNAKKLFVVLLLLIGSAHCLFWEIACTACLAACTVPLFPETGPFATVICLRTACYIPCEMGIPGGIGSFI